MVGVAVLLIGAVLAVGNLFFLLHSLPERMAHKSGKLQSEIVAVLCLLSLFTNVHLFWVVGLLLALVDLPDFRTPLGRIAGSLEKIAGPKPTKKAPHETTAGAAPDEGASDQSDKTMGPSGGERKEMIDA